MSIFLFLLYTLFCCWIVFRDGAAVIEGWKSSFLLGWLRGSLTTTELKFYACISWVAGLLVLAVHLFSGVDA